MSQALQNLLSLIDLERLEDGLFRGQSQDMGFQRVFGGQVVSQALSAAGQTVPKARVVHSFHSYFLRPGDSCKGIIYDVENLRDGNSFSARRVKAVQNGQPIFYMTASFQGEENGYQHQKAMPTAPRPDNLPSDSQIAQQLANFIPEHLRGKLLSEKPFEVRPVTFRNPLKGEVAEPENQLWIRANGSVPARPELHQYLLGYISDYCFLPVALQPHGKGFLEPDMQVATIDHSMWFHRPCDLNRWLLYSTESPSAGGARGFVRGEFYAQDGTLVASAVQEGVMRRHQ